MALCGETVAAAVVVGSSLSPVEPLLLVLERGKRFFLILSESVLAVSLLCRGCLSRLPPLPKLNDLQVFSLVRNKFIHRVLLLF